MNNHRHFLLICCPSQSHINPSLLLAKRLIHACARVTFATTVHGLSLIKNLPSHDDFSYASFSDGFDSGTKPSDDMQHIISESKRVGSQTLTDLILTLSEEGRPVTFLVYSILLPWAADVAHNMSIPSAFFCIHSATAFALYYHFFNSHKGLYCDEGNQFPSSVKLQGLPSFANEDLPSFLLPTSPHAATVPIFQEHVQNLEKYPNPCVLLNTFGALEEEAIQNVGNLNLFPIGPLIRSVSLEENNNMSDTSFSLDLFHVSKDYIQWLNSKPTGSVIYVSFGSMVVLQIKQMEEIFHGLVSTRRPFLWVVRSVENTKEEFDDLITNKLNEEEGLIVPWCSQVEVLSHDSLGCFVTHCGWNSTMESLTAGVPVVCHPQWSDQMLNAKFVEEVWRTGVRVKVNEEGIVKREEIKKCVEIVMGSGGGDQNWKEMRMNAKKWRELALEAVKEDGSSEINFRAFMEKFST